MAVRLSIVSSYNNKGVDQAVKAMERFERTYNTADFTIGKGTANLATFAIKAQQAGNTLKTMGAGMSAVGNSITKYITAPALGAATAVGAIFLAKGWSRLTAIDDAKKKLEGLGHSAESISSIMDSAGAAVRGTAYGLGDAATVAAATVAAGVAEGEELTRVLTLIGDAATIAGTDYQSMGAIFNKVAAKGKISAKEINQLTQKGIPVLQALAEQYGVTAEEASKMVSSGEVDFEGFAAAMEKYLGGAAQKSGETFSGAVKNINAAMGRIGANLLDGEGGGIFTALKPVLEEIRSGLSSFEGVAAKWGNVLGEAFREVYERGKDIVRIFLPSSFSLEPAADTADKFKAAIDRVFDALEFLAKGAKTALDVIPSGLKTALVFGAPVLSLFGKLTSGVGSLFIGVGKGAKTLANFTATLTKNAAEAGKTTGAYVKQQARVKLLGNQVGKLGGILGTATKLAAGFAAAFVVYGLVKFEQHIYNIVHAITGFKDGATVMEQAAGRITGSVGNVLQYMGDYVRNIDEALAKQSEFADHANKTYEDAGVAIGKLDYYSGIISAYAGQTGLTATQQAELAKAVEYVNQATGDNIEIVDAENGKLSENIDAINENIEARKRQIEADAALAVYEQAMEQHVQNVIAYKQADAKEAAIWQQANEAAANNQGQAYNELAQQAGILRTKKDELAAADTALGEEMTGALEIYGQTVGSTDAVTSSVGDLGLKCYDAAGKMSKWAGSADTSSAAVASAVKSNLSGLNSYTWGQDLGFNFADGLDSYKVATAIGNAASRAADAAASRMHFSVPKAGIWSGAEKGGWRSGLHLGENFAAGITAAGATIQRAADTALRFDAAGAAINASASPYGYASQNTTTNNTTNIYIDGAALNSAGVENAVGSFLLELQTLGVMNG